MFDISKIQETCKEWFNIAFTYVTENILTPEVVQPLLMSGIAMVILFAVLNGDD